ncbi:MAG: ATPase [Gammaproteobacteria bacterium]|nr:ATPase [Gammaproteobacteria bacterium]
MRIPSFIAVLILLTSLAGANGVRAEVVDAAAGGFTTRYSVDIDGSRQRVYRALVSDIGRWWSDDHTVSGHASNLTIDARPLGCFCEKLGEGAGLVHMTVTFANPGVMLRMTGGLGPLGLMGVAGNMTFEIDETDSVSTVTLQYAVGGYLDGGLDQIAPAVDDVLIDVLGRLKQFIETNED